MMQDVSNLDFGLPWCDLAGPTKETQIARTLRIHNSFLCIRSGPGIAEFGLENLNGRCMIHDARYMIQDLWNSACPGAIWDELADETQVAAITYAKLLVSNQVWARACPGATCQGLLQRLEELESGVYIIRFC